MKLLVATRSAHKLREIRAILRGIKGLRIVDLNDVGVAPSAAEEEVESFDTFEENAKAKAGYFHALTGLATVADDSGLEVDALGGKPGVHSKRFAPDGAEAEGGRDRANNKHLLKLLGPADIAGRTARYVCVAALETGRGEPVLFRGEAEGLILGLPRGKDGFGYDPLFYDRALGLTFAELNQEQKNARSHRGAAFRRLADHLRREGTAST